MNAKVSINTESIIMHQFDAFCISENVRISRKMNISSSICFCFSHKNNKYSSTNI